MSVRKKKKRFINEKASTRFTETIAVSPTVNAETIDELLDKFTWKSSNVMDTVATNNAEATLSRSMMEKHYDGKDTFLLIEFSIVCLPGLEKFETGVQHWRW